MTDTHPEKEENRLRDLHPAFGSGPDEQTINRPARWQGGHLFRLRQPSRLPAFSRHYFPGDPLKLIDWKAYARSDQLLVREDKRPAAGTVLVCIDTSASMLWPHPPLLAALGRRIPTKFEIAARVALHICHQRIRLGDHVVLVPWLGDKDSERPGCRIPCRNTSQVVQLFHDLLQHGFTPEVFLRLAVPYGEERRFEHGYWISDGLGRSMLPSIAVAAQKARNLVVMSSLETDLGWLENSFCYFDDSREKKEYLGGELKAGGDYAECVAAWQKRLQDAAVSCNSAWQSITDETPIVQYQKELLVD